ncbi:MAG: hypothetical protein HZA34_01510 [Candidatus Pacebacteria bacterium]|nr:hypothetical protein [Candidatus Paceibacterota bacterium]
MKKKELFMFLFVFIISMFIRFWRYEHIPYQTDGDEMAYVFAGQSLVEFGEPISWSSFSYPQSSTYKKVVLGNENLRANGEFTLVRPWFDHPYLLAVIEGWNSVIFGYHFPSIPPSLVVRIPMLFLAGATLILVFAVSRLLFGKTPALFSLALMGFTPSIAFGQRMVVGENLFIPLMLAALYCVLKKTRLVLPILLLAMAGLSKITGLLAIPVTMLPLILEKRYKTAAVLCLGSLGVFFSLYLFYAGFHGWQSFMIVMQTQTHRLVGWGNPAFILSHPGFHTWTLLDAGYYLILLFGLQPLLSPLKKERRWLVLSIIFSGILVWMTGAEQDMLGWYKLPFFTFLAISSGMIIEKGIPSFAVILVWMAAINNIGLVRYPFHPLPSSETLRFVVGTLLGGSFLLYSLPLSTEKSLKHTLLVAGFIFYAGVSIYTVDRFFAASCESRHCPTPLMTFGQVIRNMRMQILK